MILNQKLGMKIYLLRVEVLGCGFSSLEDMRVKSGKLMVNFLETSSKINILYVTFTLNYK